MDPRQLLSRLVQLNAEMDAITKQLAASGMPPEQIMAAIESSRQQTAPTRQPGMGAGRGPDLPPGIPANGGAGIQATNAAMGVGGPQGLLGAR